MSKVLIVYESRWGNTKHVVETIIDEIKEAPETEVTLCELKDIDTKELNNFDTILIGSPNHIGNATMSIRTFIDKLRKLNPEGKLVAFFDTYFEDQFQVAINKMEKLIGQKASGLKLISPSLSIKVEGIKGPIANGELAKAKEFGIRIVTQSRSQV